MIIAGQFVISKCGRDAGKIFIVTKTCQGFVFIADGNLRKLLKPKKKKLMHVQKINYIDEGIKKKLDGGLYIEDADLVKAIRNYESVKAAQGGRQGGGSFV